jgi:hypothetical protein
MTEYEHIFNNPTFDFALKTLFASIAIFCLVSFISEAFISDARQSGGSFTKVNPQTIRKNTKPKRRDASRRWKQ